MNLYIGKSLRYYGNAGQYVSAVFYELFAFISGFLINAEIFQRYNIILRIRGEWQYGRAKNQSQVKRNEGKPPPHSKADR